MSSFWLGQRAGAARKESGMKHHAFGRPIGKCKGCVLNLRRTCAAGVDPRGQWVRGHCALANNTSQLEAYLFPAPPIGAKAAKLARKARTSARIGRVNGFVSPGGIARN